METFGPVEFDPKNVKGKVEYSNKYIRQQYVVSLKDVSDEIVFTIDIPCINSYKWSVCLKGKKDMKLCGNGECTTHDDCEVESGIKKLKEQFKLHVLNPELEN